MEYISVLDLEQLQEEALYMPGFFTDLNLDQLMKLIQDQSSFYEIKNMFYRFPKDGVCEDYRRQIYEDVKTQPVYDCLEQFTAVMRQAWKSNGNQSSVETQLQKNAWYAAGVYSYCRAVTDLQQALAGLDVRSEGLQKFSAYLNSYVNQQDFLRQKEEAFRIRQAMDDLHLILVIENNKITVTSGTLEGAYETYLGEPSRYNSPFIASMRMSDLEEELFGIFQKKHPELFDQIRKFARDFPSYGDETIYRFEKEIQYYLAFCRFQRKMEDQGFAFCVPERDEGKDMEAKGLYDLALACSNYLRDKAVVSNDFVYGPGETFFVVNGPNQGGKTTFARSLGQLVFFTKMGLDVPACRANVHRFSTLLTHFSVEESMESGRGKLMEELDRLAPMMEKKARGAFVIINELFTTAAHYDGCVMGARVLEHFTGNGCRGIYVTHLKELGDVVEGVVTMTAMLDGTDAHRRTYKILRNKAEDVGYAEDIVEKYQLTYDRLHERLTEEQAGWQ